MDDHAVVTLAEVYSVILAWTGPFEYENATPAEPVSECEIQEAQDEQAATSH